MGLVLAHWSGNNAQIRDEGVEVGVKVEVVVEAVSKYKKLVWFFEIWM